MAHPSIDFACGNEILIVVVFAPPRALSLAAMRACGLACGRITSKTNFLASQLSGRFIITYSLSILLADVKIMSDHNISEVT